MVLPVTAEAPEPVFNLHTTGPHNFIAEGVLGHNFTELRWIRTWTHRLFVDPFYDGVVEGAEALGLNSSPTDCSHFTPL
jgi:hypothetical protein